MEGEQGIRITTWNVNGIRNPFGYQPWRQERTFAAMFEILEADIVVMQETKIQRKDLRDDMVLVPGWDVFFSLPKHKKGYSGVAIYTRNSVCAPIRAEEGITGILTPPNSDTSFHDLPEDQQIGGYPTPSQLSDCALDTATLDSEGRCVVLEFPAFVLIGTYCPATRDESRDEFRLGFLTALEARVRNLVAAGKRVFLTGDLNIIREERDTANLEEQLKKRGMTVDGYLSAPARRMFNHLLVGGRIIGERDEGRGGPVMWDICRGFHPDRKGMYTCWEQKINARPGNFGSRIDYVLCSQDWKDWFSGSDIQEGLMGSDHCPVYAVLKNSVNIGGEDIYIRDIMSDGMFKNGVRQRDWCAKDLLPMSAKLIPEFDRRRSIRDMFTKKPRLASTANTINEDEISQESQQQIFSAQESSNTEDETGLDSQDGRPLFVILKKKGEVPSNDSQLSDSTTKTFAMSDRSDPSTSTPITSPAKRPAEPSSFQPQKKAKSSSAPRGSTSTKSQPPKGQSSLMGFFKPETPQPVAQSEIQTSNLDIDSDSVSTAVSEPPTPNRTETLGFIGNDASSSSTSKPFNLAEQKNVIDPIVAKEGWSKLLSKRVVPRCEHNEPCISYTTKKAGVNCGRSFYMCPRPLGPSGQKEKNTQWRCGTFIWSSDWTGDGS